MQNRQLRANGRKVTKNNQDCCWAAARRLLLGCLFCMLVAHLQVRHGVFDQHPTIPACEPVHVLHAADKLFVVCNCMSLSTC